MVEKIKETQLSTIKHRTNTHTANLPSQAHEGMQTFPPLNTMEVPPRQTAARKLLRLLAYLSLLLSACFKAQQHRKTLLAVALLSLVVHKKKRLTQNLDKNALEQDCLSFKHPQLCKRNSAKRYNESVLSTIDEL